MGDRDAGHALEALAQHGRHIVHAAGAVLAVHQAHVDAGVYLALRGAGVERGQGVAHFWQLAQDALDLLCLGLGGFQRRTHRGVEIDGGFRKIGLGHKLGTQQRHHEDAQHEDAQGDCQGGQLVNQ
ncbi:hypothetical protein D3C71_1461260 [compost metagenome]